MDSGLVGLHIIGTLTSKSVTISGYLLGLGGAVPPGSGRPQIRNSWIMQPLVGQGPPASHSPSLYLICKHILTKPAPWD